MSTTRKIKIRFPFDSASVPCEPELHRKILYSFASLILQDVALTEFADIWAEFDSYNGRRDSKYVYRQLNYRFVHSVLAMHLSTMLSGYLGSEANSTPWPGVPGKLPTQLLYEIAEALTSWVAEFETTTHLAADDMVSTSKTPVDTKDGTACRMVDIEEIASRNEPRGIQYVNAMPVNFIQDELRSALEQYRAEEKNAGHSVLMKVGDALLERAREYERRQKSQDAPEDPMELLTFLSCATNGSVRSFFARPIPILAYRVFHFLASRPFYRYFSQSNLQKLLATIVNETAPLLTPSSGSNASDQSKLPIKLDERIADSLRQHFISQIGVLQSQPRHFDVAFISHDFTDASTETLPPLYGVTLVKASTIIARIPQRPDLKFSIAKETGVLLVRNVLAGDEDRSREIALARVDAYLEALTFTVPGFRGHVKRLATHVFTFDSTKSTPTLLFGGFLESHTPPQKLTITSANEAHLRDTLALLSTLEGNTAIQQRLRIAVSQLIRAQEAVSSEDKVIKYWTALESLLQSDATQDGFDVIAYRSALLSPLKFTIAMDGVSYGALRDWTREDVEDAYMVRNSVAHQGGTGEANCTPIANRLKLILSSAIHVILFHVRTHGSNADLEHLLAWILRHNPTQNTAKKLPRNNLRPLAPS